MIDLNTELKPYLRITSDKYDSDLTRFIAWTTSEIEKKVHQPVVKKSAKHSFRVYRQSLTTISLPFSMPLELVKVELFSAPGATATDITSKVNLFQPGGIWTLYKPDSFAMVDAYHTATLNVGYVTADVPGDLKRVCSEVCRELAMEGGIMPGDSIFKRSSVSESVGGVTKTVNFLDLNPRWKTILSEHTIATV